MNANLPSSWTGSVTKAAGTLLLVAMVAYVSWRLFQPLLPMLLVLVGLLTIYRWLVRGRM